MDVTINSLLVSPKFSHDISDGNMKTPNCIETMIGPPRFGEKWLIFDVQIHALQKRTDSSWL
jgi:hypothetical protein